MECLKSDPVRPGDLLIASHYYCDVDMDPPQNDLTLSLYPAGMAVVCQAFGLSIFADHVRQLQVQLSAAKETWTCQQCYACVSETTFCQKCTVPAGPYSHPGKYRCGYEAGWSCCNQTLKRSPGCHQENPEEKIYRSHTGRPH